MRWYHVLLVATASVQATSDATPTSTLISPHFIVAENTKPRFLRSEDLYYGARQSFKNGESKNGVSGNSDERAGALEKLTSSKTFKSITQGVSKATNTFSEKISPALPIKAKLQVWSNNGKSVSFVRKALGMAGVDDALLTQAKDFKYYDDYVTSQLPIWAKQELTPNEVVSQLGLQRLSGVELMSNPNFKYYDQYLRQQALVWAKKDLSLDDILVRLNLNTLPVAARPHDVNFKYYEEFVGGLIKTWMKKGTPLDEVMAKLKLDQLTGEALVSHRNYKYYKNHVKNYLKEWALYDVTVNDVAAMLGLENKFGQVLKAQPNYVFLKKYWETSLKYQEEGMLRKGITSFQVWKELEVFRVKLSIRKRSGTYQSYKRYVNLMDDYIIDMKESGFKYDELPRMTSKDATPDELHEKTLIWSSQRRPEWYVKFSLGLDDLTEDALKAAPNYRYYEYYLEAMKRVTTTT